MALVAHKYMLDDLSEDELRATFAAREHILDFLVSRLREQTEASTLTSFLITGPRGAGKTTMVRMLCLRIDEDDQLRDTWLPIRFPEELPGVTSLRDLLVAALHRLEEDHGLAGAGEWHGRAEAEADDEQSQELAIAGLRQISEQTGKRLILFIENLHLVFERKLDRRTQGTLRRLLMDQPFMMVVGTAVRVFEAVQDYEEAFFNYFCPVPLERLNDDQVHAILLRRAEYDGNGEFERQYQRHQAKIQALTRLTGGNPRIVLMLYEVLSHGNIGSVVVMLRQVVDELTPLLKDVLENQFSDQQTKVLDALMRAGGTATPRGLAQASRLSLNKVTTQLQRLKDMQVLEVRAGGKGRAAYYTVPDQLFCTWYQLRYLRPHRRRIEMFVEAIRIWFEEDARLQALRRLSEEAVASGGSAARDRALTAEYFAASLVGTRHHSEAEGLAVQSWLRVGYLDEAALALAEMSDLPDASRPRYEAAAYAGLGNWSRRHHDVSTELAATGAATEREPENVQYQFHYGVALAKSGDYEGALSCFERVAQSEDSSGPLTANAIYNRGTVRRMQGDMTGAIADWTAVATLVSAAPQVVGTALYNRGLAKMTQGDTHGAMEDWDLVAGLEGAALDDVASALLNRGLAKQRSGDSDGATKDFTSVVGLEGAPPYLVASALTNRAGTRHDQTDTEGALTDAMAAARLSDVPALIRMTAASNALHYACIADEREIIDQILSTVKASASEGSETEHARHLIRFLRLSARPQLRDVWPYAWRALTEDQPAEVVKQLAFLGPVAEVLETGDTSMIDPLPPEQRRFTQEALREFGVLGLDASVS